MMAEDQSERMMNKNLMSSYRTRIVVRMGKKARRSYNFSYVEPHQSIGDLHYEVARVTRP